MDPEPWKAIRKKLRVPFKDLKYRPVKESAIKAYEKQAGIVLPESYRTFCSVIGPGMIGDVVSIAVPGWSGEELMRSHHDLATCNATIHKDFDKQSGLKDPSRFIRSHMFGWKSRSPLYWDPQEVTDKAAHEMAIYVNDEYTGERRLADTFLGFVRDVCLGERHSLLYDEPLEAVFLPA